MLQQLSEVAFLRRGNPEAWETVRQQQIEQVLGVAGVGLLPPHRSGSNLGRIPYPQLVAQFRQRPLEPWRASGGLDPHPRPLP